MELWLNIVKGIFGPFSRQYNEELRRVRPGLSAASIGCSELSGYELVDSFFSQPLLMNAKSSSLPALPENLLPLGQSPRSVRQFIGSRPFIREEVSNGIRMLQVTTPNQTYASGHSEWFVRYSFISGKLFMTSFLLPSELNSHQPDVMATHKLVRLISPEITIPDTAGHLYTYQQNRLFIQVVQGLFCNQIRIADNKTLQVISSELLAFMDNRIEKNLHSYLDFHTKGERSQPA